MRDFLCEVALRFSLEPDTLWHRITVGNGTHSFEWTVKGVKDIHRNPWKDISF